MVIYLCNTVIYKLEDSLPENISLLNHLHAQNVVSINKILENNNLIELSIPE